MKFKGLGITLLIGVPIMLSGCASWNGSQSNGDQTDVHLIKQGKSLDEKDTKKNTDDQKTLKKMDENQANTVERQVFLLDKNGVVVPQTLKLPATEGVAAQTLRYLVKGGPVEKILPDGFQAVLPEGTDLTVDLNGGTLTVDFSRPFNNYAKKNEQKILQAITWTATQFSNIHNVKLQINGHELASMPKGGTPIAKQGASRADGINMDTSHVVDMTGSSAVTLYFPAQNGDQYYFVPVTKRMNMDKDRVVSVVNGLIQGPGVGEGLVGEFSDDVALIDPPTVKNHVVTLNFNKAIYSSTDKKMISNEALKSLVLSLTSQEGIKKVAIKVDGKSAIQNEKGQTISEPVSRPKHVNEVGL